MGHHVVQFTGERAPFAVGGTGGVRVELRDPDEVAPLTRQEPRNSKPIPKNPARTTPSTTSPGPASRPR